MFKSKSLEKFMRRLYKGRNGIFGNASNGLECNEINRNRKVSRHIYEVDIAHNSQVVKSLLDGVHVQGKAHMVNSKNAMVSYYSRNITGRT
jgi:hypothetical protein